MTRSYLHFKRFGTRVTSLWLFVLVASLTASATPTGGSGLDGPSPADQDLIRVVIGFQDRTHVASFYRAADNIASMMTLSSIVSFSRTNAMAVSIPGNQYEYLHSLASLHDATYVEMDQQNELQAEIVPYGIELVQGNDERIPLPPPPPPPLTVLESVLDECFRVCVVDSGLAIEHPDIPFELGGMNVDGRAFGLRPGMTWHGAGLATNHGTHVTGTIFAEGGNELGVSSMIPNNQGICLLVARVFDAEGVSDATTVLESVEWCADQGARVINMSLGRSWGNSMRLEADLFKSLAEEGVLVVAAAGNGGTTSYGWPASYPGVLSVAAVGEDLQRSSFSQVNDQVDIAAPGFRILSTSADIGMELIFNTDAGDVENTAIIYANIMAGAPSLLGFNQDWFDLEVVDCGSAFDECDADGKVCLIERGETTFDEKIFNCFLGGGIAALIYNNVEDGEFRGLVRRGTAIPAVSMTRREGIRIREEVVGKTIRVSLRESASGYSYLSGTSMSSPHVTGVATKIWAARPLCTREQIKEALVSSAINLGDTDEFGAGLVQSYGAYDYILSTFDPPCGNFGVTLSPTGSPTGSPSSFPSAQASDAPSDFPSLPAPSDAPSLRAATKSTDPILVPTLRGEQVAPNNDTIAAPMTSDASSLQSRMCTLFGVLILASSFFW